MSNPAAAAPVPYRPDVETIAADEVEVIRGLGETMLKISNTTLEKTGEAKRSVHVKSHGVLRGTLTVLPDLPEMLRQGAFAAPLSVPVTMRFSTPPAEHLADKVSLPRALAFKLAHVDGARLPGSEHSTEQDFVMVNGPAFFVPDAKAFLGNLKLLATTTEKAPGAKAALSSVLQVIEKGIEAFGGESGKIMSLGGFPETHILGESFFTQVPSRYGQHLAKFSLAPVSANLLALKGQPLDMSEDADALRHAVSRFFEGETAVWELRVQLCTDLEKMPIEDASVAWDEEQSPYIAVARIEAAPQASWSEEIDATQRRLTFSPWNGLAAHQPLGSINRARKPVYEMSQRFRREHMDTEAPQV